MSIPLPPHTENKDLDFFNQAVQRELMNQTGASTASVATGTDDQGRPTVGTITLGYQLRYLWVAYSTSSDGTQNFTNDYTTINSNTIVYQGLRNDNSATETNNPADYTWRELAVVANWIPSYRVIGGRQVDWSFTTDTPTGFTADSGDAIDLDNLPGAAGQDGADSVQVNLVSNMGTAFRNAGGSPATVRADVYIGGNLSDDAMHNTYEYNWTYQGNKVCINNDRTIVDNNGVPLTSSDGMTCTTGVVADSNISTSIGSALRRIIIGPEDVSLQTALDCEVTNIREN